GPARTPGRLPRRRPLGDRRRGGERLPGQWPGGPRRRLRRADPRRCARQVDHTEPPPPREPRWRTRLPPPGRPLRTTVTTRPRPPARPRNRAPTRARSWTRTGRIRT